MPATTARTIIVNAFDTIGVYSPGQSIAPGDENGAFTRLNMMMGGLALQPLTKPVLQRQEFDLEADKGGPDDPYTIGVGGDFDVVRPIDIENASILLVNASSPDVEVPRALMTDDAWAALQIKTLSSAQFTNVYFNATYAGDLATINLWPVPNIATNKLVLYWLVQLTTFATLTTEYFLPQGCEEALMYQLARRLLNVYPTVDQGTADDVRDLARTTLATFKRPNTRLVDKSTDPALTHDHSGGYNILTGTPNGGTGGW